MESTTAMVRIICKITSMNNATNIIGGILARNYSTDY